MNVDISFRKVFVVQSGYNYSALVGYTKQMVFITTGNETMEDLPEVIAQSLRDFNPKTDGIVAVGKVNTTLLVGIELAKRFPGEAVNLGLFQNKFVEKPNYEWRVVQL